MRSSFQESTVEALILASPEPLPARKIAEMIDGLTPSQVSQAVSSLNTRYMETGGSFRIREIAGGYQIYIVPEFTGYVQEMFSRRRKMRLTRAALETLAIVAYRQPVTRVEIEQIRGVASDGVVHNLLEKNMITIRGRADTVGKPLQYGTTDEFLKFFGLNSVRDLPKMSEIEELIASEKENNQAELALTEDSSEGGRLLKLNIADGTYDPDRRIEIDEETGRPAATEAGQDEPEQDLKPETEPSSEGSDKDKSDSGIIVDIDAT
ncbi:MAG: SMC-Scp complex subunit ScpB [Candidatus Zixiibacteriota bacterium]|nr:MAG: SMC-Scp complex subunit ScpB [candidate division Zixibacteria bacterium]